MQGITIIVLYTGDNKMKDHLPLLFINKQLIEKQRKPSAIQVILSVLAAFFGVQSDRVRERDFTQGHAWWVYACVGAVMAILLALILYGIVKLILTM